MANITFTIGTDNYKKSGKNCYCNGKSIKADVWEAKYKEYLEVDEDEAQVEEPTPAEEPAPAEAPEVEMSTDTRGRIYYKQGRTILMAVQPARTHYTLYISKSLVSTPEQVAEKLANFKIEAVVNPTFKKKEGKDPYSVKATLTEATRNDLPEILAAIRA